MHGPWLKMLSTKVLGFLCFVVIAEKKIAGVGKLFGPGATLTLKILHMGGLSTRCIHIKHKHKQGITVITYITF